MRQWSNTHKNRTDCSKITAQAIPNDSISERLGGFLNSYVRINSSTAGFGESVQKIGLFLQDLFPEISMPEAEAG